MFSWLFGKGNEKKDTKPSSNEPAHNKSIQNIQDTVSTLEKKERLLEKKCQDEEEKARAYLQENNRAAAAQCLKRKKQYKTQIERIAGQKQNLEQTLMTLEESVINVETLKTQKEASKAIKKVYGGMTADDIEDAMDDIRNTMQDADQISLALSQNVGNVVDEGELEDELADLENALHEEEMAKIKVPKTQVAPIKGTVTAAKAKVVDPEEEELEKELAALME